MTKRFDAVKMKSFYEHDAGRAGRELAYGRLDIVFKELKKRLKGNTKKSRVLEIGVSDGYLVKKMRDIKLMVYGLDIAFGMLKLVFKDVCLEEKSTLLIQSSITHLPFTDNSFDAVTACEILEHLDEPGVLKALKELKRVLIPGGSLFITTPYNEQVADSFVKCPDCGNTFPPTGHYCGFDEKKWVSLANDTGFSDINVKKIYGTDFRLKKLSFCIFLIRLAARLFSVDSLTKMFVIIKK